MNLQTRYIFNSDTTVYAIWRWSEGNNNTLTANSRKHTASPHEVRSNGSNFVRSYSITIISVKNGRVIASKSNASEGKTVTLTVSPDTGCRLGSLNITDSSGAQISATSNTDGTHTFTMPSSNVTITPVFVARDSESVSSVSVPVLKVFDIVSEREPILFTDVPVTYPLYGDIRWAAEKGLMNGYTDGTYRPEKAVSSITVIAVLGRMDNPSLKDAAGGFWYSPYVNWANNKGIIPSDVRVQDSILTRGEMARMLVNYLKAAELLYSFQSRCIRGRKSDEPGRTGSIPDPLQQGNFSGSKRRHFADESKRLFEPRPISRFASQTVRLGIVRTWRSINLTKPEERLC